MKPTIPIRKVFFLILTIKNYTNKKTAGIILILFSLCAHSQDTLTGKRCVLEIDTTEFINFPWHVK